MPCVSLYCYSNSQTYYRKEAIFLCNLVLTRTNNGHDTNLCKSHDCKNKHLANKNIDLSILISTRKKGKEKVELSFLFPPLLAKSVFPDTLSLQQYSNLPIRTQLDLFLVDFFFFFFLSSQIFFINNMEVKHYATLSNKHYNL